MSYTVLYNFEIDRVSDIEVTQKEANLIFTFIETLERLGVYYE